MAFLIRTITGFPKTVIVAILLVTAFFAAQIPDLTIDNSIFNMIPPDHPVRLAQKSSKEEFGVSEMILVGLIADNVFEPRFLEQVERLSARLLKVRIQPDPNENGNIPKRKIRCVEDVFSLSSVSHIHGTEEGMEVRDLMESAPRTADEMKALISRVHSWDFYLDNLVSRDSQATIIGVKYKRTITPDEWMRMVDAVRAKVDSAEFGPGVEVHIAGEPVVSSLVNQYIFHDIKLLLPVVSAVVICLLFVAMRSYYSVLLIFTTIAISVVWTMGLMPLLGLSVSLISSAIPVLMVAIGSADAIHIIKHFADERRDGRCVKDAVTQTLRVVGMPVFATSLTTMAGFGSLATSRIVPIREFGLFTAMGSAVALVVSVMFVPAFLLVFQRERETDTGIRARSGWDLTNVLVEGAMWVVSHKKVVLGLTIPFVVVAGGLASRIYPDMVMVNYFRPSSEIRKSDRIINEKFTGSISAVVTLESDTNGYFKGPEALRKLDSMSAFLRKDPKVGMVVSLATYMRRMNYAMNGNDPEFDRTPPSREMAAQYLLLYSNPDDLEEVVTSDYRKARIVVTIKDGSITYISDLNKRIHAFLDREFPHLERGLAGTSQMGLAVNQMVIRGQFWSLLFSLVAVFLISSLMFRSFVGGVFTVVPLGLAILLNFAILGAMKIPLDVGTAIIAGIAIGVGIDYAIHFLNGVKHGHAGNAPAEACKSGIHIAGNAIIFNAMAVGAGFMVLCFSSFVPLVRLGVFVALTMVTATIGTLVLLPALIDLVRPRFLKTGRME